jgi:hypothetical protein
MSIARVRFANASPSLTELKVVQAQLSQSVMALKRAAAAAEPVLEIAILQGNWPEGRGRLEWLQAELSRVPPSFRASLMDDGSREEPLDAESLRNLIDQVAEIENQQDRTR